MNHQKDSPKMQKFVFLEPDWKTTILNHIFEAKVKLSNFHREQETIKNDTSDLKKTQCVKAGICLAYLRHRTSASRARTDQRGETRAVYGTVVSPDLRGHIRVL